MSELRSEATRADRLDKALRDLLSATPDLEAAAVVSFDGLPMASALPASMDEDRVAAMSAALLSLGERAAEGLGRGELSQVFIEGEHGTVFLISADGEAVLVAVASKGAKTGLMLYEVKRCAADVANALRVDEVEDVATFNEAPAFEAPAESHHAYTPEHLTVPAISSETAPQYEGTESPVWASLSDGIADPGSYVPNGGTDYAPYGSEPTGSTWS